MIRVDLTSLVPPNLANIVTPAIIQTTLVSIAEVARANWIMLAQQRLRGTSRAYAQGILPVAIESEKRVVVVLEGMLPNMVEHGWSGGDQRQWLLGPGARNRKRSKKGGWYNTIPFRHGAPGTTGANFAPMGSQFLPGGAMSMAAPHTVLPAEQAGALGKAIYKQAKGLSPTTTIRTKGNTYRTKWGGRLPEGLAPKLREHHATDIFAGMVRQQKTYAKATQSQYTTFRRISTESLSGWFHPGIVARNFAAEVHQKTGDVARQAFANAIAAASRGG